MNKILRKKAKGNFNQSLTGHKLKYSDEYLLNSLKELSKQLGKTPSGKDIAKAGKVSAAIYYIRFGSLGKAQRAAGLIPNKFSSKRVYSDKYLLIHLKKLSKKLGRTPTLRDIDEIGKVSRSIFFKRFGGIVNAQKAAGLIPSIRRNTQKYSNKYLLSHLKELAKQLGKTPSYRDIDDAEIANRNIYAKRFGSLGKAQKAAGLIPNKSRSKRVYSDKYLLIHLKKLSKKLGRTPTVKDITDVGKIDISTYIWHFGSIRKAQQAGRLIPTLRGNNVKRYSDEYLLIHLKELAMQLGRTPSSKDIADEGKVGISTYINHFGSIHKAQQAAELVPSIRHHIQKYSDEYLLNYLRELSKKLGRTPTKRDIINECKVSISTYYKHFGNLSNAQKAAGLIPNKR
jgi:hypothetical protein